MTETPRPVIVPGSFDPVTNGHVDIIERASRLFDRVVVAVLVNPGKSPLFSLEERLLFLAGAVGRHPGVEVDSFQGLLVDYARRRDAAAVVRGLRRSSDFDYEAPMAQMNRHLAPGIETVFLVPSPAVAHISSTLVRDIVRHGGSIDGLVPDGVTTFLARRRESTTRQHV
ncbi:MAG TPA: pantetheine-phosphate adenylyltransferase [Vicinamibacterales bacterium]|nr:pantetheine-phosphate adenylyltransferase [Vicinamibacterales bacterium]